MIENLENINSSIYNYLTKLYKKWYVDFKFENRQIELVESAKGYIPKNWKVCKLEEIIDFSNGYAFASKDLEKDKSDEKYSVFKMGNIKKGGGLNIEGTKSYVLKVNCSNLKKYVLQKGDVLMAMTDMKGNIAILGNTAIMNIDNTYIVNQRVGLLRSNNKFKTNYPFIYFLTNEFNFLEYLRGRSNSGVQVNLTSQAIKEALIILAPDFINEKFNKIAEPLIEETFKNIKKIKKLNYLKSLYLKKFFN